MSLEIKAPSVCLNRSNSHSKSSSIFFLVFSIFIVINESTSGDGGLLPTGTRHAENRNLLLSALHNAGRYWSNRNINSVYDNHLIKQRVPRSNAQDVSKELEQAALAKVYEGILGLRAANKLKEDVQDGGEGEEKVDSLQAATANLIQAFAAADKTAARVRNNGIQNVNQRGPNNNGLSAGFNHFQHIPMANVASQNLPQFGNMLKGKIQNFASPPNQSPIAGNMKNFLPGTMGKWQSPAAELIRQRTPQSINNNNNQNLLRRWFGRSDNGAISKSAPLNWSPAVSAGVGSSSGVGAGGGGVVTTAAPPSLTNWANRNLAQVDSIFSRTNYLIFCLILIIKN